MERFLYRLSKSNFRESFILKGSRPTMDIDLMGRTDNGLEHIRSVIREVCSAAVEQDRVVFKEETMEVQRIKEDAEYEGARVRLTAMVSNARLPMEIGIGFGDALNRAGLHRRFAESIRCQYPRLGPALGRSIENHQRRQPERTCP
jgi:hypothetical protein